MSYTEQTRALQKETFLKCFEAHWGIAIRACEEAGIGRTTYYDWRKADPVFDAACKEIESVQVQHVESHLLKNIRNDDTTAMIFYLKTKGKHAGYWEGKRDGENNVHQETLDDLK